MDLEADLAMDATYAYYLSGTFIPPSKPEAFAYFGMEPEAYLGLHIQGNAQMQTTSGRKKIVDTLTYPGLAVKGIAAVGPTLDVYGEVCITRSSIDIYNCRLTTSRSVAKSHYTEKSKQEQHSPSARQKSTGPKTTTPKTNTNHSSD